MSNSFEIVSAALFVTNVGVDGSIPGSARQVFALSEGNVLVIRVFVALCQPEIDNVDVILGALGSAN